MSPTKAETFRELLSHDHKRLDDMLAGVLKLLRSGVQPALDAGWAAYEDGVLAHLDAEEMYLLPGLTKHDAVGAARIRDDHARIRELLAEIGIGLELHIVREDELQQLAQFLQAHASMEEEPLYRWADTTLPKSYLASLVRRLRATWKRVAPPEPPHKPPATPLAGVAR